MLKVVVYYAGLLLGALLVTSHNVTIQVQSWAAKRIQVIGNGFGNPCKVLEGGNASDSAPRSRQHGTRVFLFQNDEKELLPDWLQYHSYLFGINNIHVIDHSSQDAQIRNLLSLYGHCGSTITKYDGAFANKSVVLSELMRKVNSSFLIPLDTDEFIVSVKKDKRGNDTRISIDREAIVSEILSSPIDGRKYKFNTSRPVRHTADQCAGALNGTLLSLGDRRVMAGGSADPFQYEPCLSKTFYYSHGFISTDQGNHYGMVKHDKHVYGKKPPVLRNPKHYYHTLPTVSLLHYTASSYAHLKAKILRGAMAYGFKPGEPCEATAHGNTYCKLAQDFRNETEFSRRYYLHICTRTDVNGPDVHPMTDWFANYTLTLDELVGA